MLRKRLNVIAVMFVLGITSLQAQTSVNSTGGNASSRTGSVSYSVGQVVYQNHESNSGSVSEGVQQPYEISVVFSIEYADGVGLYAKAYPNPTIDNLVLEVKNFELSDVQYKLYDINGKLMQSQKITSDQTPIDMVNFAPATYFLKVFQGNTLAKTFEIVKN